MLAANKRKAWNTLAAQLRRPVEMRALARSLLLTGLRKAWNSLAAYKQQRGWVHSLGASFRHPQRRKAFSTWASLAAVTRAQLGRLQRCVAALQHLGLRRALNSLVLSALMMASAHQKLWLAALEWRGRRVRGAWLAWRAIAFGRRRRPGGRRPVSYTHLTLPTICSV
eukprot:3152452-Prymnesium_polylepis.1